MPASCVTATVSVVDALEDRRCALDLVALQGGQHVLVEEVLLVGGEGDDAQLSLERAGRGERVDYPRGHLVTGIERDPRCLDLAQVVRDVLPAEQRRVVLGDEAQWGIVQEEAHDGEHVVVLGELQTGLLRGRSAERVHLREHGNELATVHTPVLVQVIDHGAIGLLVVAVADVRDAPDRLEVDVGDADLDLVRGHPWRRRARRSGDTHGADEQGEHDRWYEQPAHLFPPKDPRSRVR